MLVGKSNNNIELPPDSFNRIATGMLLERGISLRQPIISIFRNALKVETI